MTDTDTNTLLAAYISSCPELQSAVLLYRYQSGHSRAFGLTRLTNAPDLARCLTPRVWAVVPAFRQQLLGWLDELLDHRPKPGLRAVGGTTTRAVGPFTASRPSLDPARVTTGMETLRGGFLRIERPDVVHRVRTRFSRDKTELNRWTHLDTDRLAAAIDEERRRDSTWDDIEQIRIRLAAWFDALENGRAA